jgi:hypothetical protein
MRTSQELDARQRRAAVGPPETDWYQCLLYPVRAWPVLLPLAVAWAGLLWFLMTSLAEDWDPGVLAAGLPLLLPGFLLLGYTCAFYGCVLASAAAGEARVIRWPGADLPLVLRSGAAALVGFLAGPVVPVAAAFLFWLHSGDLEWVDHLILWELGLVAVGCWVLAVLAVQQNGRLRDANPFAVARLARQLGRRGWLAVTLITLCVLLHLRLALGALEDLHHGLLGLMLLTWWGFWWSAWVVFLLRWYGLSRFWAAKGAEDGSGPSFPEEQRSPDSRPGRPHLQTQAPHRPGSRW